MRAAPLVLACSLFAASATYADDAELQVEVVKASDSVYRMKAVGVVDAPPEVVFSVLSDTSAYADTMPYIEKAEVVQRSGNAVWLYVVMDAPLARPRDYCIKLSYSRLEDGGFRIDWVPANELAPASELIRIEVNDGYWILTPVDGGARTRAEHLVHADPAGALPKWLVARATARSVPSVYENLGEQVAQPRYAQPDLSALQALPKASPTSTLSATP